MDYIYGRVSKTNLATCKDRLQLLFNAVGKRYNCSILEGHRGKDRQNLLFDQGKSKVRFPEGKHNEDPSLALDAAPYPISWSNNRKNIARFYHFAGYVKAVADIMEIKIRWGGDWDSDRDFSDQNFDDLVHFELIE